jgi:hypothetical protein
MFPSRASSAAMPRSHTSVMGALSAQRSYTPPAVICTGPGTSRLMLGGRGGAAGAAATELLLLLRAVLVAALALVLPVALGPLLGAMASSAGAPHTPLVVHVGLLVSGSMQ